MMKILRLRSVSLLRIIVLSIFLITGITGLMGCAGYHYVSSMQYVPLNNKKGEFQINGSPNSLQLGYSITDHISLFATGCYDFNMPFSVDGGKENSGHQSGTFYMDNIDLGMSIFKKARLFNYELLAGIGGGKLEYDNKIDFITNYESTMNADKEDIFIQPDFGYKFRDSTRILFLSNFELSLFSRFIYEKYFDITTSTTLGSNKTIDPDDVYFQNRTHANLYFAEPGLLVRARFKKIKFYCEWSVPLNLTNIDIQYRPVNMYVGISFSTNFLSRQN